MRTCDPDSPKPLGEQIVNAIREAIDSGEVAPGERLPTMAGLAKHFGVSNVTIAMAVRMLKAEHRLVARQGCGIFVCTRPSPAAVPAATVEQLLERLDARLRRIEEHLGTAP